MDIAQLLSGHANARSMRQGPELTVVMNIIRHIFLIDGREATSADKLPCDTKPTYLLQMSDASRCVFKCSPGLSARLLRSELHTLENESRALSLLNRTTELPVPRRIRFVSNGNELTLRPPYLVRSYIPGTPLSELSASLPAADLDNIERALGAFYATLSGLAASSFGTLQAVQAGSGTKTWRMTFVSMVEAALRDAEDILISLPYDSIRHYITAHSDSLDALPHSEPRLTALSFCSHNKVLIDEDTSSIVGLLGLDDVLWGDPDMALQSASPAFLEGYDPNRVDDEHRQRRALMYAVYRAIIRIVKAHYRARVGEDELSARQVLADSLNALASYLDAERAITLQGHG